jgi:quinohemoprotein ethanol dehydrogenase
MVLTRRALPLITALVLAACSGPASQTGAGDEWTTPGGDGGKSHHSLLTDISASNISRLGLAWEADLGTGRGIEATPVMVDGVLYLAGMAGRVYAFDAATGNQLWYFEPEIDPRAWRAACCDAVNRGVAVKDGTVFVAALDGRLYALDAKTGKAKWSVDSIADHGRGYASTGAPEVAGDVVVIGNGGAEFDARGYVTAYDIRTGQQKWRFWTVPRDPRLGRQDHPDLEKALTTWDRNSRWDVGGGGTVWDAINYDPATGLVIIGVGNGGPYHHRRRSPNGGSNLYLSSLVALDARTGRVKWHYQETPGDSWDFTATQPMILTDMDWKGERRPVILHAPKNGFLYILDRRDGKLLSASPIATMNWASGVDLKTGKPRLTPQHSDYLTGPKIVFPSSAGARNWQPGTYDPQSGVYFAPVIDVGALIMTTPGVKPRRARALNNDAFLIFGPDIEGALPTLPPPVRAQIEKLPEMKQIRKRAWVSELRAIDPATGRTLWRQPMQGWQDRAGVLSTASGLIFQGNLAGQLRIFDARTGKLLRSIETGRSILAAPMTYRIDGVQYVAVATGWGGGGWPYVPRYSAAYTYGNANRLLVFRLDGKAVKMPQPLPPLAIAPEPPAQLPGMSAARIARGQQIFMTNCAICHANQYRSTAPDLRHMAEGTHQAFRQIVLDGLLQANGMPAWSDLLSPVDADDVHGYLIDLQKKTRARELRQQKDGTPIDTPAPVIMSSL